MSSFSGPPSAAGGTLVNSMEGPGTLCLDRQPLKKTQKKRRSALVPARPYPAPRTAVFSFRRSRRRKQTRLRKGPKWVNFILGDAVSSFHSHRRTRPFLESTPSYSRDAAFASFPCAGRNSSRSALAE